MQPVAGVVDEDIDLAAPRGDRLDDLFGRLGIREIRRDRERLDAVSLGELRRERLEAVEPTRDEAHVEAPLGEQLGEGRADPGARAGDERKAARGVRSIGTHQKSALRGVRGKGITSRTFAMPVA